MTNKQFCKIVEKARKGDERAFIPFYEEYFPYLLKILVEDPVDTTLINNMAKEVIWKMYCKYVTDEFEPLPNSILEEVKKIKGGIEQDKKKTAFFEAWSKLSDDCKTALSNFNPTDTSKNNSKCMEQLKNNF